MHPEWAPLGAARFLELVDLGDNFWKGVRFFRVIEGRISYDSTLRSIFDCVALTLRTLLRPILFLKGFMAQFGIPGKPELAKEWQVCTATRLSSDKKIS